MTRLTGLITHNWPLKLAAIALATLLYAGLALSQNARIWPGRVPIEAVNQPSGAFLLENLGDVTTIRYYAPADVAARISSSDFQALADLSSVTPVLGGAPVSVPVQVIPLDPRIKVLDFQPDRVAVRLDPVITRTVPITVERGTVPAGLQIGDPVLGAQTAAIRGASSLVERVETGECTGGHRSDGHQRRRRCGPGGARCQGRPGGAGRHRARPRPRDHHRGP